MKIKKKIYILFSGQLRFFEENLKSIEKSLKYVNKIYLFCPWTTEIKKIKLFKKNYKISKFELIKQKDWTNHIKKVKYPDRANSHISNLFYMWDALIQSFEYYTKILDNNDIVIRLRTDIKITSKKFELNFNEIKNETLYIPDCYHWNGLNDQVFVSKVSTLKKFKLFFKFLENMIRDDRFISPEYVYYKFIKMNKLNIVFFNMDYQILRKKIIYNKRSQTIIPLKDQLVIKTLKLLFKLRNFNQFFIRKSKRNKNQNLFYE